MEKKNKAILFYCSFMFYRVNDDGRIKFCLAIWIIARENDAYMNTGIFRSAPTTFLAETFRSEFGIPSTRSSREDEVRNSTGCFESFPFEGDDGSASRMADQ
jgi:hypothetical protein